MFTTCSCYLAWKQLIELALGNQITSFLMLMNGSEAPNIQEWVSAGLFINYLEMQSLPRTDYDLNTDKSAEKARDVLCSLT